MTDSTLYTYMTGGRYQWEAYPLGFFAAPVVIPDNTPGLTAIASLTIILENPQARILRRGPLLKAETASVETAIASLATMLESPQVIILRINPLLKAETASVKY